MKKLILASSIFIFAALSCGKTETSGCQPATVAAEKPAMVAYCTANAINYTEHSSGILYEIVTQGTGAAPALTNKIYVTYTGKLLSGTIFDQGTTPATSPTSAPWYLSGMIDGWKIALPLLKKGGKMKMVIPSSLAYGCSGYSSIPSNAPLYFEVSLLDVQ